MVSKRWVWVESMGVASGCGCKEAYTFPYITYPYSSCICFFFSIPTFSFFFMFSFTFRYFFVILCNIFSHSINTHTGDYGRPTAFAKKHTQTNASYPAMDISCRTSRGGVHTSK